MIITIHFNGAVNLLPREIMISNLNIVVRVASVTAMRSLFSSQTLNMDQRNTFETLRIQKKINFLNSLPKRYLPYLNVFSFLIFFNPEFKSDTHV